MVMGSGLRLSTEVGGNRKGMGGVGWEAVESRAGDGLRETKVGRGRMQ